MMLPAARPLLGQSLQAARNRAFVGREAELAHFRAMLDGHPDAPTVLYLHGPGGAGKSMLLRRLGADARDAGRPVVEVDGRMLAPAPGAFEAEAAAARAGDAAVLLVDTFDRCQDLEPWLRDHFLPTLPAGALAVLASRQRPDARWLSDPGWARALRVVPLRELSRRDALALLEVRGVPPALHDPLLDFSGGHPLALSLAAAEAARAAAEPAAEPAAWRPPRAVVESLLAQLVGEVPTPSHRRALEVCAHAHMTSEDLLRAVLPEEAGRLFGWLRQLPFVESGPCGLYPHDVARSVLLADLCWRDPRGFAWMHGRMRAHLAERVRYAADADVGSVMGALMFLYRGGGSAADPRWRALGTLREEECSATDRFAAADLADRTRGTEAAATVRFWAARQPGGFRVLRRADTGRAVAFSVRLRLTEPTDEELATDPVVATVWAHCQSLAPPRSGEHVALARFWLPCVPGDTPSALDFFHWRMLAEAHRADRPAWSYTVARGAELWDRRGGRRGRSVLAGPPRLTVDGHQLYAHDWRAEPLDAWLGRADGQLLTRGARPSEEAGPAGLAVLSRAEFDAAVRRALGALRSAHLLAENPLSRGRLVGQGAPADRARALREVLVEAVHALRHEPRGASLHRAVAGTFLHGARTQKAAAERLGVPFSTYRRHLAHGVDRICEALWHRELDGSAAA